MKTNILKTLFIAIATVCALASCNKQPQKNDAKDTSRSTLPTQGMVIAVLDLDSLTNNYEYAKIMNDSLETKRANAASRLNDMDKSLERTYNNIQRRLQNNEFTSEQQYKNAVSAFEQERNNRVGLEARLSNEFAQMQADFLKALQDSLDNYLAEYNKDKKFDMIINKAAVLSFDTVYDITQEIINGLNNRYQKKD